MYLISFAGDISSLLGLNTAIEVEITCLKAEETYCITKRQWNIFKERKI